MGIVRSCVLLHIGMHLPDELDMQVDLDLFRWSFRGGSLYALAELVISGIQKRSNTLITKKTVNEYEPERFLEELG